MTTTKQAAVAKVVFNSTSCGRCGGSGRYHVQVMAEGIGGSSQDRCFKCRGRGHLRSAVTERNRNAFFDFLRAEKPTESQSRAALESGRFGRAWRIAYFDADGRELVKVGSSTR